MKLKVLAPYALTITAAFGTNTYADDAGHNGAGRADSHAPVGVMGDHLHKKGELMLSYRHMYMSMSGNQQEGDNIGDDTLVTTVANRFAAMDGMPPTLRIVPQEMDTSMHMLGMMYAPSDQVTLMVMANYLRKTMQLVTYQGGMGTNILGYFSTQSEGFGDTKIAALISLLDSGRHKAHFNLGFSLPTGAIDRRDGVLPPSAADDSMRMDLRLPYAMQLGSGTYDFEPGLTYTGKAKSMSWGMQYRGKLRINDNEEDYRLGDEHGVSLWAQYLLSPAFSTSMRFSAKTLDSIDGIDSEIMGPVQSADPSNYGGDSTDIGIGFNFLGQSGFLKNHRLAFEYSIPLMQDLNGVQMEMQSMATVGYQYAF